MNATDLPVLIDTTVAGVAINRHVLDAEAARVTRLAQRVGQRLRNSLRNTSMDRPPDADWLHVARWYSHVVLSMLREQRERALIARGEPVSNLEAQLAQEFIAAAKTFSDDEWALLDRVRAARPRP